MLNKSRAFAVVAAIGLLATAGCGGSGGSGGEKHADAHDGTSKTTKVDIKSKVPSGSTKGLKDPLGARSALEGFRCTADDTGAWTATGTLKNDDTSTRKYLVSVSVVKTKGNEVLGAVEKVYEVPGGKSEKVELAKVFVEKDKGTKGHLCVPRVVSGT